MLDGSWDWSDISGRALVAVDLDHDGFNDDLIIFDSPSSISATKACFADPSK